MPEKLDLIGQRFGRLKVIGFSHRNHHSFWNCICDCGGVSVVDRSNLKNRNTKSCGCLRKEISPTKTHGLSRTPLHRAWESMKRRCNNKNDTGYKNYGGRGIAVCNRWMESFENFYEDMGEIPSKNHSIDRIDNNGDYEPGNCRWATRKQQCRNKRNNVFYEFRGKKRTLGEISEITNINEGTLRSRIFRDKLKPSIAFSRQA